MRALHLQQYIVLGALAIVLAACGSDERAATDRTATATIPFRDDGDLTFLRGDEDVVTIDIEIAETDSARRRGLMQRNALPEKSGMLFVFERAEPQSFWMADTPIALDLFFVGADSQIVDIDKYTRPFSAASIVSEAPARYVIETPAGFADTYGIVEGQRVRWTRGDP